MTQKYTYKLFVAALLTAGVIAQAKAQSRFPTPGGGFTEAPQMQLPVLPTPPAITPNGDVVEDVIVRVNDQIITRSELERSEVQLIQEAKQNGLSQPELEQRQRDLLRDLIDQQLLLSKGKDLGISGDAEMIRRLDDIRKQNHLDSMEALEKSATQQGVNFEEFKATLRDNAITQQVVRDEVGRRVQMTKAQEQTFYDAHKNEFEQPESIHLSEILVPTPDSATDAEVTQAQAKADDIAAKLKAGTGFADAAKQYSGDTASASRGGELGDFKRGTLGKVLEDATFALPVGGTTAPIRTRQGFVILHVDSHTPAGIMPLSAVEPQVEEALYMDNLQPALRAYLTKARENAYVDIKPGFVDTGSSHKEAKPDIAFTTYTPPKVKKKTEVKNRLEAQRDAAAQERLAEAREKAAEKAAAKSGATNTSGRVKVKKVRREKVRFGQAPRNSLPTASTVAAETGSDAPLGGQAPGVAMAAPAAATSISTGTGVDPDAEVLAPQVVAHKKTRYSARQTDVALAKANDNAIKAREHISARPVAASADEKAAEQTQAAPLGLKGDTAKKQPKRKRQKGEAKERLQEKPVKPVDTSTPVAPTVNPALGGNAVQASGQVATAPESGADRTTLPPANAPAPGDPPATGPTSNPPTQP